ncbi:uncharacterized protein zgc:193726 isoform X1 [Amphiprion ocellaris]|uniref:uncharacterized protein zgc:193726 isoform X1 n=1 Tax=Amphiprion ocellaris TaxID=80972 RepID=UPI001649E06E|nr:uncharacterized protein zgc:193726 isoform X1 [Amphiprion ocellaris]
MTTRMKTTKTTTMMMMMMVVCVSAASLGGSRRDDMKVEGSHLENPENVSTSLKSHQDVNETLDVSTRLNSHQDINETLDNSTRITINQDVNRTVDDSTRYAMSNLPINETSITPLMFHQQQQNRTKEDESHERKGLQFATGAVGKRFGLAPPKACQLSICAVMNLGHELQSGGDELAGQSSSDPFGHGK